MPSTKADQNGPDERERDGTFRVHCMRCGKCVSSPLSAPVTIRAWVECPECIEAEAATALARRHG
jgi:hypothetical protein